MQKVALTISHLTGKGWKKDTVNFSCDENIGLLAGRDQYATARGSAITVAKNNGFTHTGTDLDLVIDGKVQINIHLGSSGKFEKSEPVTIN